MIDVKVIINLQNKAENDVRNDTSEGKTLEKLGAWLWAELTRTIINWNREVGVFAAKQYPKGVSFGIGGYVC